MTSQTGLNTLRSGGTKNVAVLVNQAWVAWKFRSRLMLHLRSVGYRVVLLTDFSAGRHALEEVCDELVHVPMAATRIAPLEDLRTFRQYQREFRRLQPLAVLSFTIKPNIYGALAAHRTDVPVIANVTGLGSIKGRGGLVGSVVKLLYRWALRKDSWVYFQNSQDAAEMRAMGVVPEGRWSVLPGSGVDIDHYRPAMRSTESRPMRFCMLARLLRDKGVVEFAEAARQVKEARPHVDFELWGILDKNDFRCVTSDEILAWETEGLLSFRGEARDALQAFSAADAVVLPSYYPEGLPRTLLEAGAMGLPSITTDTPGCRDAVVDGVTGLLCAPRDVGSLAKAMLKVADMSTEERANMGSAARERVLSHFDEKLVLHAYSQKLVEAAGLPISLGERSARGAL